ncbi:hypothetical protein AB1Y20_007506 [Prymnesium parvum]|uniref:SAP domain-containing protein n=1 Tax=Prymnesium parvum TaxID=97485 RepID=A0AB34IVN1_PRYPA
MPNPRRTLHGFALTLLLIPLASHALHTIPSPPRSPHHRCAAPLALADPPDCAEAATVPQLRAALRVRGLRISGRKAELVRRLAAFEARGDAPATPPRRRARPSAELPTTAQLREALRARGLPLSGRRSDLLVRLRLAEASARIGEPFAQETRTVAQLRAELRARGLPVSGRKAHLLQRLAIADRVESLPRRRYLTTVLVSFMEKSTSHDVLDSVKSVFGFEMWSGRGSRARLTYSMGIAINQALDDFVVENGAYVRYILGGFDI